MDEKQGRTVLILTAAMGSGHVRVSEELRRRLHARGHRVIVTDLLALMPRPFGTWLGRLYPWLVDHAPWLYDRIYRVFFQAKQRAGERVRIPVLLALPGLRGLLRRVRPDVVVSTYHLAALAAGRLRDDGVACCPAISFITTFSVHDLWLHPGTDLELCVSAEAAQHANARTGRFAEVVGPVVGPEFDTPSGDPGATRAELGVAEDARIALVAAGSLGMGSIRRSVEAIAGTSGWVPVVLCGRDEQLRERLARIPGAVALGWRDDVAALMQAAHVLVENAGGLSAKEALRCGLPVVTYQPIAGHGRDDVRALHSLGLTDVAEDEPALRAALRRLGSDGTLRAERAARGRSLFVADAADPVERLAQAGVPAHHM